MKLRFVISIFILFYFSTLLSQQKELLIEYDFYFKDDLVENKKILLQVVGNESLSTTERTIMVGIYDRETGISSNTKPHTSYTYVYKNRATRDLLSSDYVPGRQGKVYIKDTLNLFDWKLTGNTKHVLNYNCQEATTSFRGREYIAYFTSQLPFKGGPWKFHGLPGVILEVKAVDDKIKIDAKSLKVQPNIKPIIKPFNSTELIASWEAYEILYKKELDKSINRSISKLYSNNTSSDERSRIGFGVDMKVEIIVPENALSINERREARNNKK